MGWSAVGSHVGRARGTVCTPSVRAGTMPPAHCPGSEGARSPARGMSRAMGSPSVDGDFNSGDGDHRLEMPRGLLARCLPCGGAPSVEHGSTRSCGWVVLSSRKTPPLASPLPLLC